MFAPILTPNGVAAFGRDLDSAKQVWSKHEGYPGDANYREFYRGRRVLAEVAHPALRSTDRLRKQMVVDQADPH